MFPFIFPTLPNKKNGAVKFVARRFRAKDKIRRSIDFDALNFERVGRVSDTLQ